MNHQRFRDASHASVTDTLLAGLCGAEQQEPRKAIDLSYHIDEEEVPLARNDAKEPISRKFGRFFGS